MLLAEAGIYLISTKSSCHYQLWFPTEKSTHDTSQAMWDGRETPQSKFEVGLDDSWRSFPTWLILWFSSFLVLGVYISNLADVSNTSYFERRNADLLSCYQIVFASWNPNRKSKNKTSQEHLVVIALLLSFLQLNSSSAEGEMQLFSCFPAQGSSTSKHLRNNLSPPLLLSTIVIYKVKLKIYTS